VLEHEQQRKYLHGLAQAHIVRQTRAQSEPGEQVQPSHAGLLVRPQAGLEFRSGADLRQPLRLTQLLQDVGQPRACNKLRPVAVRGGTAILERDTRQKA